MRKELFIPWDDVNKLAISRLSVNIQELRHAQNLSVIELDLVDKLCFELATEAKATLPCDVTVFPHGWGRPNGGITMRFDDARYTVMFKLYLEL